MRALGHVLETWFRLGILDVCPVSTFGFFGGLRLSWSGQSRFAELPQGLRVKSKGNAEAGWPVMGDE